MKQSLQIRSFASQNSTNILDVVNGVCTFDEFDIAMRIHANDSIESKSAHEYFFIPPKLTLIVILEGDLDANIDGTPLSISAYNGPAGYLNLNRKPVRLDRWTRAGQHIRKLTVGFPIENIAPWFGNLALTDHDLTLARWEPSDSVIAKVEALLAKSKNTSTVDTLDNAMVALEILQDALTHYQHKQKQPQNTELNHRENQRATQVKRYILNNLHASLTIQEIANNTNMSASTLQRVFKRVYGMTVIKFMRTRQLEMARLALLDEGVSVGEAAFNAGYSCTANFSTAFLREFGTSPSTCMR